MADKQWGLVTTAQARRVGAGNELTRLAFAQVFEPVVMPGALRLRGGARHPFPQIFGEWLLLEPEVFAWERAVPDSGVVSHHAAARVYGIGDHPGRSIGFTVPAVTSTDRLGRWDVVHAAVAEHEWRQVAGLPVTSPERTVADLAGTPDFDPQAAARIAGAVLRKGLASPEEVATVLAPGLDPPEGLRWLQALLDDSGEG